MLYKCKIIYIYIYIYIYDSGYCYKDLKNKNLDLPIYNITKLKTIILNNLNETKISKINIKKYKKIY